MDETPTKRPRSPEPRDDDTVLNEDDRGAAGADHDHATDDDAPADHRPKYRSWKKKWRKLRVTFDAKMHEAEVLWTQEQKAKATIKRIAVENEYVFLFNHPFPPFLSPRILRKLPSGNKVYAKGQKG